MVAKLFCRSLWWLVGLTGFWSGALAEPARPVVRPLHLIQPLASMSVAEDLAEHFRQRLAQSLGEVVQHHSQAPVRGLASLRWAATQTPAQDILVLMPALLYGQWLESERMASGETAGFTPLQSVLHNSWCLMAPDLPQLRSYDSLHAWLVGLHHRVRLGVPGHAGFVRIWLRAMEIKTGLEWEPHLFSSAHQGLQELQAGQIDLLIERCDDVYHAKQGAKEEALLWRVLLRTGTSRRLAEVPSFASWQIPPLSAGWMVWMVPSGMSASRQEQLYTALHAIMEQSDTQQLIAEHYNQPLPWSRAQTEQWVQEQESSWKGLLELLDHYR